MRKLIVTLILTTSLICFSLRSEAAITAPDAVEAGQLAVCKSDRPATWAIYPQSYRGSYYVAGGGSTCIFASPAKGVVTIMAASVDDNGGVDIAEHTLYNGEPAPTPDKTDDDAPDVTPAPETLESVIETADVQATAADLNALSNAFATVVQSIDNGAIKTPAGARETFRAVWLRQAALTNPAAIDTFSPLLTAISNKVDNTSLQTVKRDYTAIVNALRAKGRVGNARQ